MSRLGTLLACLALVAVMPVVAPGRDSQTTQIDADGHRYTIKRLAKKEIRYRLLDGGWVRVAPYFQYRLEREDADYLYVREYVAPASSGTAPAPDTSVPKRAAAADEEPALPRVDRIMLAPFGDGLPSAGQWRNAFALADLNGDGHRDLVHGPPRKAGGGPRIFLGDGAGHWRPWKEATYPRVPYDYGAVAVADFNGDAQLDLALAAHMRGITVLWGDGRGRFRIGNTPSDLEPVDDRRFTTRTLLAHDWNRDGRPDLLALGEGPGRNGVGSVGWAIYLNQADGRWQKRAQPPAAARTFGDALAVGDFDGDGRDDLLTASHSMGNRDIVHYGGAQERTVTLDAIQPQALVYSVASADFDDDGRDDLAVGYLSAAESGWRSLIDVLRAAPDGSWRRQVLHSLAVRTITFALGAGDADGDGHQDLAALDDRGGLRLFLGDGAGRFAVEETPELQPLGAGCRGYHVQLADLNGDGRDEVLAAFASETSPLTGEPGCPNEGRLQAWTAQPKRP